MTLITPFQIYMIGIADSVQQGLRATSFIFGCVFVVAAAGLLIAYLVKCDSHSSRGAIDSAERASAGLRKWLRNTGIAFVISFCAAFLMPSTKLLATMYVVPVIVNNPTVQELPQDLVNYAKQWLHSHTASDNPAPKKKVAQKSS